MLQSDVCVVFTAKSISLVKSRYYSKLLQVETSKKWTASEQLDGKNDKFRAATSSSEKIQYQVYAKSTCGAKKTEQSKKDDKSIALDGTARYSSKSIEEIQVYVNL
jgi:hypothetical protein